MRTKKNFFLVLIITILVLIISFACFKLYEYKTKTTNLSKENIDNIYLLDNMEKYNDKYSFSIAKDVSHPGYEVYNIDKNVNKLITVNKNKKNSTIYRIQTSDISSNTSKNVSIGTSVEDLIKIYGENYIERSSDQSDKLIEYVDRDNNILITFFIYKDKVDAITLEVKDFYKK